MKPMLATCLATALLAAPAYAHTPYLHATGDVSVRGGVVSLDASFAEVFFIPEAAFDNSRFEVIGPDGRSSAPDSVHALGARVVAEHRLGAQPGTYRFSTGHRYGALFRTWEINGERVSSRDPAVQIPAGANVLSNFQSLTVAETYVSVGEPDRGALVPRGKGLELVPIDHPNDLYTGEKFRFTVQYDGMPLSDQKVEITEAVWTSDRAPEVVTLVTDAEGNATFNLERAGTWVALSRYRTRAPADAVPDEYSNSYTLTFRVLEQ